MADRPTWALIDEATQAAGILEGLANTIAKRRRDTADYRLALHVAQGASVAQRKLAQIEREDEETQ